MDRLHRNVYGVFADIFPPTSTSIHFYLNTHVAVLLCTCMSKLTRKNARLHDGWASGNMYPQNSQDLLLFDGICSGGAGKALTMSKKPLLGLLVLMRRNNNVESIHLRVKVRAGVPPDAECVRLFAELSAIRDSDFGLGLLFHMQSSWIGGSDLGAPWCGCLHSIAKCPGVLILLTARASVIWNRSAGAQK